MRARWGEVSLVERSYMNMGCERGEVGDYGGEWMNMGCERWVVRWVWWGERIWIWDVTRICEVRWVCWGERIWIWDASEVRWGEPGGEIVYEYWMRARWFWWGDRIWLLEASEVRWGDSGGENIYDYRMRARWGEVRRVWWESVYEYGMRAMRYVAIVWWGERIRLMDGVGVSWSWCIGV